MTDVAVTPTDAPDVSLPAPEEGPNPDRPDTPVPDDEPEGEDA